MTLCFNTTCFKALCRTAPRLALSALMVVVCVAPAGAIDISISGLSNNTSISLGGPGGDRAASSSASVTGGGGSVADIFGNTVAGSVRYVSNAAADRPAAFSGGTASATVNTDYQFNFNTTAPTTVAYSISVATRLTGGLTAVDDAAGVSNGGTARVSDVSGSLNGSGNGSLGLGTNQSRGGAGLPDNQGQNNVNATNTLNLGPFLGTGGAQSNTLRFTFQTFADSPQAINGGDEMASRFGLNDVLGGADADNYPGVGGRDINNDGHFVTVTATVVNVAPTAVANGPYTFSAASPSLTLNSSGSSDPDPGQSLSYDWKAGATTIGTSASPTVNVFTTPGFTISTTGGSQAGTLTVTDNGAFNLNNTAGTSFSYANTAPVVSSASAVTNFTTYEVTFAGIFDDADLAGNGFISSFEDITYELDLTAPGTAAQVGPGGFMSGASTATQTTPGTLGPTTYSLTQLLTLFGGLGTYTIYASVADSTGAFISVPVEVRVVPEPASLLVWSGLGAIVGLTAWRRRRQTK